MPMRNVVYYIAGLAFMFAANGAFAQGRIQMTTEPAFDGMSGRGVTPVVVTLQNVGPSVEGAVTVDASAMGSARDYVYPVSLPTGSVKRIVTYPRVNETLAALHVSFKGSFAGKKPTLDVPVDSSAALSVALISDQVGGLGVLRSLKPEVSPDNPQPYPLPFRDAYAKPENAPDRAAGYATLTALALSNGAERLTPHQWEAIRRWTMAGGIVICTGGAGAVYLQTPGAAAVLPVRNVRGATVQDLSLPNMNAPLPAGPYALMTGEPTLGASILARSGPDVTMAARRLGAGTVVFLAFSPFESPLRGWPEAGEFWRMALRAGKPIVSWQMLRQSSESVEAAPTYVGGAPMPGTDVNPFHIQLPPVGTVAMIFGLYFLLAVPVTYIVLKRMKRLEWAWITNPMLAGVFAFVFYLFTAQLYQAGMSRRTSGVLVAAAGGEDAVLLGYTQMFFPRGGAHPLVVPNAESLEVSVQNTDPYGGSRGRQDTLTTVDTGVVSAPNFSATNLAFRSIYYVQPVSFPGGITARLTRDRGGNVTGTVRNGSGRLLRNAVIIAAGATRYAVLGDMKPGETARVNAAEPLWNTDHIEERMQPAPGKPAGSKRTVMRRQIAPELRPIMEKMPLLVPLTQADSAAAMGSAMLLARTPGETYGPSVGRYVPGGTVDVLISLPMEGGA